MIGSPLAGDSTLLVAIISARASSDSQRYVYRHLVTVEVSVISRTHQWVQLDRFTFDQLRFERLNTQTVQCWCTVQHYRVFTDNVSQDIPDFCGFALNHFLRSFNGCRQTTVFHLLKIKGLNSSRAIFFGRPH